MIRTALPTLERSEVVDESSGGGVASDIRTSSGAYFDRAQDKTIAGEAVCRLCKECDDVDRLHLLISAVFKYCHVQVV